MKTYDVTLDDIKRFYSHIEVEQEGQCWNWVGPLTSVKYPHGPQYPQFRIGGRANDKVVARKLAYFLNFNVHSTEPLRAMCENDLCVNPLHMLPTIDPHTISKKYHTSKKAWVRTNEELVKEIWTLRKLGKPILEIADQIGIGYERISTILKMTKMCNQGKLKKYKKVAV